METWKVLEVGSLGDVAAHNSYWEGATVVLILNFMYFDAPATTITRTSQQAAISRLRSSNSESSPATSMATFDDIMNSACSDVMTNALPKSEPQERSGEAYAEGLSDQLRRRDNLDYFIQGVTRHRVPVCSDPLVGPELLSSTRFAPVTTRPRRIKESLELHLSHVSQEVLDEASCGLAIRITVSEKWTITKEFEDGNLGEPEIPSHMVAKISGEFGFRYVWIMERMTYLNRMRAVWINSRDETVEQKERRMWARGFTNYTAYQSGDTIPYLSSSSDEEESASSDVTPPPPPPPTKANAARTNKQQSTKSVAGGDPRSEVSAHSGPENVRDSSVGFATFVSQVAGSNPGSPDHMASPIQNEMEDEHLYDSPRSSPISDASWSPMPANQARGKKRVNDQPVTYPSKRDTECHLAIKRVSLAFAGAVGLLPNLLTDSDARRAFKAAARKISRLSNDIGECPEEAIAEEYSTARERSPSEL